MMVHCHRWQGKIPSAKTWDIGTWDFGTWEFDLEQLPTRGVETGDPGEPSPAALDNLVTDVGGNMGPEAAITFMCCSSFQRTQHFYLWPRM